MSAPVFEESKKGLETINNNSIIGIDEKEHVEDHHQKNEPVKEHIKPFVYVVAVVAAFGGLLFGYDIGGSGGTFVMPGFREHFGWPADTGNDPSWVSDQQGWINSLFTLGALFGALFSGTLADLIGRKKLLMLNCVIFTIGTGIQCGAVNMDMMYVGRVIGGIAIGSLSCVVTMYQSEVAPKSVRGVLVTMQQLCITFGIVIAAAANVGLTHWDEGWRISYGGNIIFAVAMFIMMIFLDDSPRWLVSKGRIEEARSALLRLRNLHEVEPEIVAIEEDLEEQRAIGEGSWREVFSNKENMLYRLFVGCGGQFLQQFCGINAIMFFAPSIIGLFFGSDVAIYGNLAIQSCNFLATFIAIALIDRVGRVSLLFFGGIGMTFGTLMVCVLSSPSVPYKTNQTVGIFIIVFCTVYVINFAYSWGPVIWVVCSEIYPQRLRGKAMSLSTATNWACASIVGRVTPIMYREENLNLWELGAAVGHMICLKMMPKYTKKTNLPYM
eukprot:Pgem_evm1s15617